MGLLIQLVFGLLCIEIGIFFLLAAPLPYSVRKAAFKVLSSGHPILGHIKLILRFSYVGVALIFLEAWRKQSTTDRELNKEHDLHSHVHTVSAEQLYANKFFAQRNMYLAGFTLLMALILDRYFAALYASMQSDEIASVVKKQAQNNNKQLGSLIDKCAELEKQLKEAEEREAKNSKLVKDAQALKKQADNNHTQYMKLADEFNALEAKYKALTRTHQDAPKENQILDSENASDVAAKRRVVNKNKEE